MTHQLLFELILVTVWLAVSMAGVTDPSSMARPGCNESCGNVSIPYPFGIGGNCYYELWYEIVCNNSFSPPKPFLHKFNLEVMEISLSSPPLYQRRPSLLTVGTPPLNICTGGAVGNSISTQRRTSVDLDGSPYRFSSDYNVFMVEGCPGGVVMMNRSNEILAGCASICSKNNGTAQNYCYGVGCCQTPIPIQYSLDFYQISFNDEAVSNPNTCMAAALMADTSITTYPLWISQENERQKYNDRISSGGSFPTKLEWMAKNWPIQTSTSDNFYCFSLSNFDDIDWNLTSEDIKNLKSCRCNSFCEGNPYLPNGCKVVKDCEKCRPQDCYPGGDTPSGYYCHKNSWTTLAPILGASGGVGSIFIVLGCYWLYRVVKKRKERKQRAKHFKRNGGLLLQQQMSSSDGGVVEKTRIFTTEELEKATDNFNENRVLGHGGQGTVYKGMLMDGRIVAIKKFKQVNEDQLEQFINEVVIVSQINHRNVVKLLGCCLETEVPLLVYEFILNGTLFQHIHSPSEDFHLTWKMRLQIAVESAGALAYLHSSSSPPIYHRDIKSSNILLDDKYRAKVSDFGTSRAINIEQTHLTTCVIGTFGYLDPEYFQSNQFTEKSDVYSFGVVLVELLTSKRPISATKPGEWRNLAHEFLFMMEDSRLFDIFDDQLLQEGKKEDIWAVANLAKQCLNLNGKLRPTMKELVMVLEDIFRSSHVSHLTQLTFPNNSDDVVAKMSEASNVGSLMTVGIM